MRNSPFDGRVVSLYVCWRGSPDSCLKVNVESLTQLAQRAKNQLESKDARAISIEPNRVKHPCPQGSSWHFNLTALLHRRGRAGLYFQKQRKAPESINFIKLVRHLYGL